ncbi:hypothetical protein LSAT2_020161 [Lamellibrachia satsuma]|nr:hypothetical protein LSAT2_020161 [Lamellibrachia satsuma]
MIHRVCVFPDYQPQGNQSPSKLRPSSNPSPSVAITYLEQFPRPILSPSNAVRYAEATTYKRRLGLNVLRSSDNTKDVMKVAMMILLAAVTVTILVTRPADAVSCTMNNCLTCDNAPLQCGRCTPGEVLSDDSKSCLDCPANCRPVHRRWRRDQVCPVLRRIHDRRGWRLHGLPQRLQDLRERRRDNQVYRMLRVPQWALLHHVGQGNMSTVWKQL